MNSLQQIRNKIITLKDYDNLLKDNNFKNKTKVFTNGCFDLVHRGHIEYLAQAADYGDLLIIGLNSDDSVRRIKGNHRPLIDQEARAILLAALSFIDYIIVFQEDTPYNLIKAVQPDVLVKGSDYQIDDIVGAGIVKAKGGKIITIDFIPGYSTSLIEKKIKEPI